MIDSTSSTGTAPKPAPTKPASARDMDPETYLREREKLSGHKGPRGLMDHLDQHQPREKSK